MTMKLTIPSVSFKGNASEIANAITNSEGILTITDLPEAPLDEIAAVFDHLSANNDIPARLNRAYTKNLVYKDAFSNHNGGPNIDQKRVLDLSPERLEAIERHDPDLLKDDDSRVLASTLTYWDNLRLTVTPTLLEAVRRAIHGGGGAADGEEDAAFNYRMVDYYKRSAMATPPRCGEHRDFGLFTLVFPSHGGLEIFVDNEWQAVPPVKAGTAIMLFGWCAQIRSNGRIPAILHRVVDHSFEGERRLSAVLFCAPKQPHTSLEPVVLPGEQPKYISGIQAGQLRGSMARKWQMREGTIDPDDLIKEEAEILATNMRTQDDVVAQHHAIVATAV